MEAARKRAKESMATDKKKVEKVKAKAATPAAKPAAAKASQSADELSRLTVVQLKEMCRAKGLKVGGRKSELVDRLVEAS